MPKMSKPTVGLFTTIEGHQSIAEAIQETLNDDYTVEVFLERDDIFDLYVPFYKFFPSFIAIPFYITKQKQISKILTQYYKRKYEGKLRYFQRKYKPSILINTYFMYTPSLQEIADHHQIPFLNVISDPRTIQPMILAEKANMNFAFDEYLRKVSLSYYDQVNIQTTGWFVRSEYEQEYNVNEVREALHLKKDVLTFLVASGSEGTNIVTSILPALLKTSRPIQVLIACGNNKTLYKSIRAFSEHLVGDNKKLSIQPIGFTKQLYLYMQAADLVIGKAGPNTLFEAVATLTPFFAITHIAGQEDGNLDIIREYKLGYVEENVFKANTLLSKIIRNPEQLEQFKPHLKKMATHNAGAKKQLKELVRQLLPKSV
jgi:UDP-N-acetylglucosamine:LPS N-acetylglucosamine transferase